MTDEPRPDPSLFKARLLALREELVAVDASGEGAASVVELDQSRLGRLSRMDAMQGQAMAAEANRRRQFQLRQIESALERIEQDEYGWCVECGEAIDVKRLDFDPATPCCIQCASKREG